MPDLSHDEEQEAKYSGPGIPTRGDGGMDVGQIFRYPFQDKDWLKKVVVMGLINLIPVAGQINLLGWMRECFRIKKADDDTLPDAGFQHLQAGVPFFLALLIPLGVSFVANIIASVVRIKVIGFLFSSVAGLLGLSISILLPAVAYIFLRDEDVKAFLKLDKLQAVVLGSGVVPYIMLVAVCLVAGFISSIGFSCLFVPGILGAPIGAAIGAAALAEFSREMAEVEKG